MSSNVSRQLREAKRRVSELERAELKHRLARHPPRAPPDDQPPHNQHHQHHDHDHDHNRDSADSNLTSRASPTTHDANHAQQYHHRHLNDDASVTSDTAVSTASWTSSKLSHARTTTTHAAHEKNAFLRLFSREFWDHDEATRLERVHWAARRLQAALRGKHERRKYAAARELCAIVTGAELREGRRRPVAVYAVTVVRAGVCWQVFHRFSDWRRLHHVLGRLPRDAAARLPSCPARLPFGGGLVRSHRQFVLNRYLQELLAYCAARPAPRALLVSFLCRSHIFWEYPVQRPTQDPGSALYDRSTGSTATAAVMAESLR